MTIIILFVMHLLWKIKQKILKKSGSETTVLNFQIYKVGMTFFDMGYAAALANILLFIVGILSVIYVMVLERQQL